jgi:tRNA(Arg) A34 adenosine deaminase TadA
MKPKIEARIYDRQGKLVGCGGNSYTKSHPLQARLAERVGQPARIFLHAEIQAIIRARGRGFKLVVERRNAKGELRNAKPCPICELAIKEAGIKYVEYSI